MTYLCRSVNMLSTDRLVDEDTRGEYAAAGKTNRVQNVETPGGCPVGNLRNGRLPRREHAEPRLSLAVKSAFGQSSCNHFPLHRSDTCTHASRRTASGWRSRSVLPPATRICGCTISSAIHSRS